MSRLPVHKLRTNAKELDLGDAKVYHLPNWHGLSHPERLAVIRQVAMMRGRDPRIARLAVDIIKKAKAKPREYKKQAAALLKWVQDPKNVYYVNEPGERLQDPIHTIRVGHGDCDDMALLLCCLFESVNLPWKLCLSGRHMPTGRKVRYIEGQHVPPDCRWAHIYCMVGDRPFRPGKWYFAEPTVDGVPLGWDVVSGSSKYLPEMARPKKRGPATIARLKSPPAGYRPKPLPRQNRRSPAYELGYGDYAQFNPSSTSALVGSAVGASVAESGNKEADKWLKLRDSVVTGVAIAVGTTLVLNWLHGEGLWDGRGSLFDRVSKTTSKVARESAFFSQHGKKVS